MDLHLNHTLNRWQFHDAGRPVLSFAWDREAGEYMADGGVQLGRVWADAMVRAGSLAQERARPSSGSNGSGISKRRNGKR